MCGPWLNDFLLNSNPNIVCTVDRHLRFIGQIDLNEISKVLQSVTDNDTVVKACFKRLDVHHELQPERKIEDASIFLKKYFFVYGRTDPQVAKIEIILMVLDFEIRSVDATLRSDTDICNHIECEELVNKVNGDLLPDQTLLHQPLVKSIQLNSNIIGENSVSCYNCERWWTRKHSVFGFEKSYDFQIEILNEDCELSQTCRADKDLHKMVNENKNVNVAGESLFLRKECLVNVQDSCCQTESFGMLEIKTESMLQLVRKTTKTVKASAKSFESDCTCKVSPLAKIGQRLINGEINKKPQGASLLFVELDTTVEESKSKSTVTDSDRMGLPFRLDITPSSVDVSYVRSDTESRTGISDMMNLPSQTNSADDKYKNNQGVFSDYHKYVDVSPDLYIYPKCTLLEINCKKLMGDIGCRKLFQPLTKYENVAAILCGSSKTKSAKKHIKPLLNDFMHEYKLGKLDYKFDENNIFRQVIKPTISPLQTLNDEEVAQFEDVETVCQNFACRISALEESDCEFHHSKELYFKHQ